MRNRLFLSFAGLVLAATARPAHAADCAALAALALPQATIVTAESVTAGAFMPPYGEPLEKLPAFCRVAGVLRPTPDSEIRFEVWLPEKDWNHKFLGTGNGGFAGSIYYPQMGGNLRRGYATAGTDTGHEADAQDASWAYHHPEKIIDFGYRGLHLATQRAKSVIEKYYGAAPAKSYFDACSDGGREALMEAQRFPEDYDGILAGAPANYWTHLVASGIDAGRMVGNNPAAYISSFKLPAITSAVLAACDEKDGLKDGILNDPRTCHFDPATLLCKGEDTLSCLTAPQVAWLQTIYSGSHTGDGKLIFPGLMPGDEAGAWKAWIVGEAPGGSNYVQNYFRYMILDDPTWNALTADVDASVKAADAKTAQQLNSTDPDLSRFAARGGKLILYHGWNDPAISPLNTISYYQAVGETMGADREASFVSLYMVPGMEHCAGGPGPSAFGQLGIPSAKGPAFGAFTALEEWVENGNAPVADIIATKYGPDHKAVMTRPICRYPQVAKYVGRGDVNDAGSFACVEPAR
jgi:feruloyl esterase